MDDSAMQALHVAIARGRGRRGWKDPAGWVRERAQLLSALVQGQLAKELASVRGIRPEEVTRLVGETCDAVLRGGESSPDADTACVATWRRWCALGDVAACERVRRRGDPGPATSDREAARDPRPAGSRRADVG